MASHAALNAEKREMLGKKVRRLRASGVLPATVYGYNIQPESIQLDTHDFQQAFKAAGRTQLIDLSIGGGPARPVFVKQTAVDPKRNALLHVEFYQANLRAKMTNTVPLHFVGDSQAVKDGGILLTMIDHVDIESLPDDVPTGIDVDISGLVEFNSQLHAGDLPMPADVTLVTLPDEIICKVNPPITEEEIAASEAPQPLPDELGGEEAQAELTASEPEGDAE